MQILRKYGSQQPTNPKLLKILPYQNFCVEYCSVYFVHKFYTNMVPSDEPKITENFSCIEFCSVYFLLKFYANIVHSDKPKITENFSVAKYVA